MSWFQFIIAALVTFALISACIEVKNALNVRIKWYTRIGSVLIVAILAAFSSFLISTYLI